MPPTVERLGRVTVQHSLEADRVTTVEVERVMQEPPRTKGAR